MRGLRTRRHSDAAIHDIRKELTRARATLRMLRECIGVDLAILAEQIYAQAKGQDAPGTNEEVRDLVALLAPRRGPVGQAEHAV